VDDGDSHMLVRREGEREEYIQVGLIEIVGKSRPRIDIRAVANRKETEHCEVTVRAPRS
jgi:hypothetical protein